ncbi:MAG: hypothetical protein ACOCXJ_02780 [Planctomycetota bacterium]
MSFGGWIIMCASVGGMTLLFGWCIWKVLSTPGSSEHLHGFEVETPDHED